MTHHNPYDRSWRTPAARDWEGLTLAEKLQIYDRHNPGDRESSDPNRRMHGRCGCLMCARVRKTWQSRPTALNKPGREGGGQLSSINLCDREGCKSMVRGRALGVVALVTNSTADPERVEKEICPGCVADVLSLLESAPQTEREPAYSDPFQRAPEPSQEDRLGDALVDAMEKALDRRDQRRREIEA